MLLAATAGLEVAGGVFFFFNSILGSLMLVGLSQLPHRTNVQSMNHTAFKMVSIQQLHGLHSRSCLNVIRDSDIAITCS